MSSQSLARYFHLVHTNYYIIENQRVRGVWSHDYQKIQFHLVSLQFYWGVKHDEGEEHTQNNLEVPIENSTVPKGLIKRKL